jgi:hypothetical protein
MMDLFDTKDILLMILNTEFLSLSQFVSHKWNVCLELEAAEYLSKVGMPGKAAEIVLGMKLSFMLISVFFCSQNKAQSN